MRTFVIPVRDLDAAGEAFDFVVKLAWLEEALARCELRAEREGRLEVRASLTGRDVFVRGKVEVELEGTCVRCLEPARLNVAGRIERLYAGPPVSSVRPKPKAAKSGQEMEDEEDVPDDVDTYDGENVVLDEAVREHILLEVPMNPLCREDCPGLASKSGSSEPDAPKRPFSKLASIVLPKKE